jgi:tryptophan 2,3-dioxygenase
MFERSQTELAEARRAVREIETVLGVQFDSWRREGGDRIAEISKALQAVLTVDEVVDRAKRGAERAALDLERAAESLRRQAESVRRECGVRP